MIFLFNVQPEFLFIFLYFSLVFSFFLMFYSLFLTFLIFMIILYFADQTIMQQALIDPIVF